MKRGVRRKAVSEGAHGEPDEQPDETGAHVHATRFPDGGRLPAVAPALETS